VTNVLCIDPVRALAKRASDRISDKAIAARYQRLAFDQLLKDPRNFRPAFSNELADAPEWAKQAHCRGEAVSVFKSNRALAARIHSVARRLEATCRVALAEPAKHPGDAAKINDARQFLAKLGRADFDTAARKALIFARLLEVWEDHNDAAPVCPPRTIVLLNARAWHRVTSVRDLRAIGREFSNCLARTQRTGGYGGMLVQGCAQFWVLRDRHGKGLMVAMAPAPLATHFMEVKRPRNASVELGDADLVQLGHAIGIRPPPPPPPPPPHAPAGVLALVLQAREFCPCDLCRTERPDPALRLRLRARAH
jgi:hypothetical protein